MGYDYTPVLLHLDKDRQADSLGYNIVKEIHRLVYAKILSEDIALWSSPSKQVQIDKHSFMEMEKSAFVPFVESKHFFIHELWRIYKRSFSFGVIGFSFTGETKGGRKINYGYIDANDVILLMQDRNIPNNANGSTDLSYWDALHSMHFDFDLVQFGTDDFKEKPMRSFMLKDQAIVSNKIKRNLYPIIPAKLIEYKIISPDHSASAENAVAYKSLETFINENKQIILNAGGTAFLSHFNVPKWNLDNIIVVEKWTKYNQLPFQELLEIQLFIDGKSVTLGKEELEDLDVKINLMGIEEYMTDKSFLFILQKVNDQEIAAHESEQTYKALFSKEWNKIIN
ncbi:MAG: hypothetical protein JXR19_01245 [Bacteroidia bacterium]